MKKVAVNPARWRSVDWRTSTTTPAATASNSSSRRLRPWQRSSTSILCRPSSTSKTVSQSPTKVNRNQFPNCNATNSVWPGTQTQSPKKQTNKQTKQTKTWLIIHLSISFCLGLQFPIQFDRLIIPKFDFWCFFFFYIIVIIIIIILIFSLFSF